MAAAAVHDTAVHVNGHVILSASSRVLVWRLPDGIPFALFAVIAVKRETTRPDGRREGRTLVTRSGGTLFF